MDQVTQQKNSAYSEETASSSEELSAQAENLKDIVTTLVEIVGGSNDRGAESSLKSSKRKATVKKERVAGKVHNIHHTKETAPAKRPAVTTEVVKPNEVIPMDENEFKEF